ncbi:hypothetical protein GALL_256500 [mine drainage metagenome]|uniref:Uncharacterized protein n=1 Tax=mine drainage metagenome TaxID=410659 RepID=A0A1J5RWC9_9ZZZZ
MSNKPTKKPKQPKPYPNQKTLWSYYMQAIEPNSNEINEAFPEYHPMWVIQSQNKTVSADNFKVLREHMLNMTLIECAAYLRVSVRTIQSWEKGSANVPFVMFELLRLVSESVHFRLSHKDWQGWFIANDGRLVSPDRGSLSFSPDELSYIRETHQVKAMYETENKRLRSEVEPLRAEIAEMRALDSNAGVLNELKTIETKLSELTTKVSRNKVVKIGSRSKKLEPALGVKAA